MRIPVLTVLPAQEPLRESAAASVEGRAPNIPLDAIIELPRIELDTSFAAVPVASGAQSDAGLSSITAATSEHFVVRGFVEADDPADIPIESGGRLVFADPPIAPFITCINTPPVGSAIDVANALHVAALTARGLDGSGVALAIMDTGINLQHLKAKLGHMPRFDAANSWQPVGSTAPPGAGPVAHGTMCAFDALIAAPKATLLDFSILSASAPGGAFTGSTIAVAVQAFAQLVSFWAVAFAPGGAGNYKALVVNNSWGIYDPSWDFPAGHPGRYVDNPNHPFQSIVALLARSGADILFAAGNCGHDCPDGQCKGRTTGTIMGANAYQEVLTVAGCDTQDARVGYSSQGPSIAGMFQTKPDITSYTHFSGSEAFGPGSSDSGTSAACPVAAGCIAAIRTKLSPSTTPPQNLFAQLRTTARQVMGAGWNADYGYGIIDPDNGGASVGV